MTFSTICSRTRTECGWVKMNCCNIYVYSALSAIRVMNPITNTTVRRTLLKYFHQRGMRKARYRFTQSSKSCSMTAQTRSDKFSSALFFAFVGPSRDPLNTMGFL